MLTSLAIQNYVLIQELNISLTKGLSIITGETGAGKSILLGALSLLVGQRTDAGVLLDKTRKCMVEGTFLIKDYQMEEFFQQNELDYEESTVIRREINPDGKSRAFVNDSPVNLTILKELGERLIDIHSQHQNLYLENPTFQLQVLDTFAKQTGKVQQYKENFQKYRTLLNEYQKIISETSKNKADLDYFQFQYNQLFQAKLKIDEQELLEQELKTLTHAEEIKTALVTASGLLTAEGDSILSLLKETQNQFGKLVTFYPPSVDLQQRVSTLFLEMKDIAQETDRLCDHTEHDPERIAFVNNRLDLIYSLQQKHRVESVEQLISIRDQFQISIDNISGVDNRLDELKIEIDKLKAQLENTASTLSNNRRLIIPQIEKRVHDLLLQLGMINAIFKVEFTPAEELTATGIDKVMFLFSGNKQGSLQLLSKVASGGEMARLMLSLKAIVAEAITLPTIIFDEIDAGVSGDIADKVGNVIVHMADFAQVINITHLPQIASKGLTHFLVYKNDIAGKTQSHLKQLSVEDRITEIARMLSGEKLSEAAINNAKALLGII